MSADKQPSWFYIAYCYLRDLIVRPKQVANSAEQFARDVNEATKRVVRDHEEGR